jgi:aminopeptidase N
MWHQLRLIVLITSLLTVSGPRLTSEAWNHERTDLANLPRYHFDVDLNYRVHRLDTVQRVTLPNTFGEPISEVVFNVPAAHARGVFDLRSVEVDAQDAAHTLDQTTLTVKLPRAVKPDETITLTLKYSVRVPELNEPQSFGDANLAYTDDAMSIGYWYPMLAPYRSGAGWYTTDWQSIGDPFVSEVADYTAIITTTPDVTVVAGGDLSRTENVWRYDLPRARTFGMIASNQYQALSLPFGGVTYTVYTLPRHWSLASIALKTTIQSSLLYTSLYGPYPYDALRVAEFSGPWSMEFSGFVVLGASEFDDYDGTQRNRLIRIAAHEVSHQWWYGVVGGDQIREPWLDEGLARFNEVRYYEAYAPRDVTWWWDNAIGINRPTAPVNSPVSAFNTHSAYLSSVYSQGARFFDALRTRLGADRFNAFLRDLYQRGSFRLITTQDFLKTLQEDAKVDVRSVVRRFLK